MGRKEHILLVDDNPLVLGSMARLFKTEGYEVDEAVNGEQCLERLRETAPDLVLLDVMLPGADGIEICRRIKADPRTAGLFVVLVSAFQTSSSCQTAGLDAGADGYIARPIANRELAARVESLLRIQRAEAELRRANQELERKVGERVCELSQANATLLQEIERRRQGEEAQRRLAERLRMLRGIDQAILLAMSPVEIAKTSLQGLRELLPFQEACMVELVPETDRALVLACFDAGQCQAGDGGLVPLGRLRENPVFRLAQTHQSHMESNSFKGLMGGRPPGEKTWRSLLEVPLMSKNRLIGVLNLVTDTPGAFSLEHVEIANEVADLLAVSLRESRLVEELRSGRERLRAISSHLVEVQEKERRYLARELHDQIGQLLTGLKMVLEMESVKGAEPPSAPFREALNLIDELLGRVRQMSLDLRPHILDDLGLLPAMQWHFQRFESQSKVKISFQHAVPPDRLPPPLETTVFRIVQEALTNIVRHAKTTEATVRLWHDGISLVVQIEDRGIGFDALNANLAHTSTGLSGMRERAELLGGNFTVESAPGAGTRLTVELPLDGKRQPQANSDA